MQQTIAGAEEQKIGLRWVFPLMMILIILGCLVAVFSGGSLLVLYFFDRIGTIQLLSHSIFTTLGYILLGAIVEIILASYVATK